MHSEYLKLIKTLEDGTADPLLLTIYRGVKLPSPEALKRYHILHDVGKPNVLEVIDGKRHFPNHANASFEQFIAIFPDDMFTATLIKMDMLMHTVRGDEINELIKHPFAPTLYFTAWAEIKANAFMFGGEESDSFKIKRKRLLKIGKKMAAKISGP